LSKRNVAFTHRMVAAAEMVLALFLWQLDVRVTYVVYLEVTQLVWHQCYRWMDRQKH